MHRRSPLPAIRIITAVALIVAISDLPGAAQTTTRNARQPGGFGVRGGIVTAGNYYITPDSGGVEVVEESNLGLSLGWLYNFPISYRFIAGLDFDLHDIQLFQERQFMINISVNTRYRLYRPAKRMEIRPGLAIGFGHLAEIDDWERTNYLTGKAYVEFLFLATPKYSWIGEFVVTGLITGGNGDLDIHSGRLVLIRWGVLL